jgi:hypothetical protein
VFTVSETPYKPGHALLRSIFRANGMRCQRCEGAVPRDFWLEDWEKQAIIRFHLKYPLEGYRRLDAVTSAICRSSCFALIRRAAIFPARSMTNKSGVPVTL